MELQFVVDRELCIGCGECARDCPYGLIEMQGDVPAMNREKAGMCIRCQHCLAVCGPGAVSIMGKNPADSLAVPDNPLMAQQLAVLMKARRSTRRFQGKPVSGEEIAFLLETAAYAPTGRNNRQVLFTVIEDPGVMEELRKATYKALAEKIAAGGLPRGMEFLERAATAASRDGQDTIFRGAPHLLMASAPQDGVSPEVDCHIALGYFDLLAAGMGIGTLWCGLATWTLTRLAPEIVSGLGVPDDHRVGYAMVFGRPAVKYYRTAQRDDARINRVRALGC